MNEFEEILQKYPEMILISKTPYTWKGFLTITDSNTNFKMKVKVKFIVPSYPGLDNATIQFGGSIAVLFGANFKKQIDALIKKSESVSSFFQELVALIKKLLFDSKDNESTNISIQMSIRNKLLKELDQVLSEYSDVEILSNQDLSSIKFTMSDISMTIQPTITSTNQNSWKIISSDLSELPGYNEKKSYSLKEMRNMFQKQVETLDDVWDQLRKIDNFCYVTDPFDPKPYHLYRRIYLSPSLSFLLTLNPLDPTGYPKIRFIGPAREVEKYRDMIQNEDAIEKWDLDCSVYENLLALLNIDEFPPPPKSDEPKQEEAMVGDNECCICFSMELDDGKLPDEICSNHRCRRHFHTICLFQWLQELATNKIVFNKIFGPCPNCNDEVSCNVPSS